jgi:hypothetical protein
MFIMMNASRFAAGLQSIGIGDAAYQKAAAYAKERVQSRPVDGSAKKSVTIIHHPDVRRMLAHMRALAEGNRTLTYFGAVQGDIARNHPDAATRAQHQALYEFLVPVIKGWCSESCQEVSSLGVQVHGGMGFIEETGAAQFYRDSRITSIYEGTTAIQANDLIGRKMMRDGGAVAKAVLSMIGQTIDELPAQDAAAFRAMHKHLAQGQRSLQSAMEFVMATAKRDPNAVFIGAVPFLKLAGVVLGGWQMARAMLAASRKLAEDPLFYGAKVATAQFFAEYVLTQAPALEASITGADSSQGVLALAEEQF